MTAAHEALERLTGTVRYYLGWQNDHAAVAAALDRQAELETENDRFREFMTDAATAADRAEADAEKLQEALRGLLDALDIDPDWNRDISRQAEASARRALAATTEPDA